ncbi:glycoside hydrolase family 99-like domain-containing protein [Candidatus Uhrbacteria bacterium]|nr:glycoside hydrolase family 99-like domain-containing protein [Candidatus Uhrbacteria bacterium]
MDKCTIKPIAFYLPQYHPIPENDRWWGDGFTEWVNVKKAKPLFNGHYQPHVPSDTIGYYDLRDDRVRERQAEIAKHYGIYGFCYYYYWFNGKKLLDYPLSEVLRLKRPDFPFCVCWANENWTRRWDGTTGVVLMKQSEQSNDAIKIIYDLLPIFNDNRYIRIGGKPLFIVYRADLLQDPLRVTQAWRRICAENGMGGIYLCCVRSFDVIDPKIFGFDSAIEMPPHQYMRSLEIRNFHAYHANEFKGKAYDYGKILNTARTRAEHEYTLFRGIMPSWDNTARLGKNALVYINVDSEEYRSWLQYICAYTTIMNEPDKQYIFINAWNEWGEGCHLEPDKKNEYRYLEITKDVVGDNERSLQAIIFNLQSATEKLLISADDLCAIKKTIFRKISKKIYAFYDKVFK